MRRSTRETLIKQAFLATAVTSLAVLALIMVFLFMEGLPTFGF
ncbi:MAG: phosphate ABC transporter permease subunit PstC, partial [Desulfovibrio sp.]|nr:phosphate ABC transporter permease subunit PstC [Desulfovibrio sp.]